MKHSLQGVELIFQAACRRVCVLVAVMPTSGGLAAMPPTIGDKRRGRHRSRNAKYNAMRLQRGQILMETEGFTAINLQPPGALSWSH